MKENYNSVNLVFMIDTDDKIRSQTKQVSSFSFVRKSHSVCVKLHIFQQWSKPESKHLYRLN